MITNAKIGIKTSAIPFMLANNNPNTGIKIAMRTITKHPLEKSPAKLLSGGLMVSGGSDSVEMGSDDFLYVLPE